MAALAAGLALGGRTPQAIAVAAAAVAALASLRAVALGLLCAVLLVAGAVAGSERLRAIDAPGREVRDGRSLSARAHLGSRPRPSLFGSSAEVEVMSGPLEGARLLVRAPRGARWPGGGAPGLELALRGELRRPGTSPGASFDFAAYLRRRGVAGELVLDRMTATGRRRGGVAGAIDGMRLRGERAVAAGLPRREADLVRGMVLGEDEAIAAPVRDDFRDSGLAHLLAVSGQNVMLLTALAMPGLAAAGLGPRGRAIALLALIAIYVPLAGAGPSLQRAGVMGAAGVVALGASRPSSRSYALLLAASATLALNPRVAGDPGWQLSFAAVAGILALVPSLRAALGALPRALAEGIAVTLAATLATAPLLAHHFRGVPLATLPANLLALPAVAPVMWLGMVKAALGQLGPAAQAPAEALGVVVRPAVAYLAWLAATFGGLPLGRLRAPLSSPPALGLAYAGLGAAALAVRRAARRLEPRSAAWAAGWRRMPRRHRVATLLAAAVLAAGGLARALGPPAPPRALTVSFLDVGQGDATLVQDPGGTAVLFDGGPPEANVVRLLRRAGVRRLAAVVATHASRDHHGGLPEVIHRFPVGLLLDGGDGTRDPAFRAVLSEARRRGVRTARAAAPMSVRLGGLVIRILSPPPRAPGPPPEDPNLRAVVAVVSSGGFDLLLSADAESEALAPLTLPDVDAMKVPHHGSADPGLPRVLEHLRPEVAAVEVGARNTYGHPAPSTLRALRRAGVPTYRTDRDGTVRLTIRHRGMSVATHR
jgi:competence protein ComEC